MDGIAAGLNGNMPHPLKAPCAFETVIALSHAGLKTKKKSFFQFSACCIARIYSYFMSPRALEATENSTVKRLKPVACVRCMLQIHGCSLVSSFPETQGFIGVNSENRE